MGRRKSRPADAGVAALGDRIRRIRRAQGLTLEQLGQATSLSHAFLSQVERDRARPSVTTLSEIAAALGISASALVAQTSSGAAHLVRGAEAPVVFRRDDGSVVMSALTGERALMKAMEGIGSFDLSEKMAHEGEELVYVIDGELEITVGDDRYLLGPGDALTFDCAVPHYYRSAGDTESRFLNVVADPGSFASPLDGTVYEARKARRHGSGGERM